MPRQVFFPVPQSKPRGFSPATKAGRHVFVSGQVAHDGSGKLVGAGDCGAQAGQCFKNVDAALKAAGATMDDVVKITAFLVNAADYDAYAAARLRAFPGAAPASSTVIVKALVRPELLVEVEALAVTA